MRWPDAGLGASLLCLGAFGRRRRMPGGGEADEDMVLELASDQEGDLRLVSGPTVASARPPASRELMKEGKLKDSHRPIVEEDLHVQEYFSDDEAFLVARRQLQVQSCGGGQASRCAGGGDEEPGPWAPPGAMTARRLMEARSRRCMICLADKQHTLVPPHLEGAGEESGPHAAEQQARGGLLGGSRSTASRPMSSVEPSQPCPSRSLEDHRFCTECWEAFLQHRLQQREEQDRVELRCPLCRALIVIPDVYRIRMGLPDDREAGPRPLQRPWSAQRRRPHAFHILEATTLPPIVPDLESQSCTSHCSRPSRWFAWGRAPAAQEAAAPSFSFWALPRSSFGAGATVLEAGGGSAVGSVPLLLSVEAVGAHAAEPLGTREVFVGLLGRPCCLCRRRCSPCVVACWGPGAIFRWAILVLSFFVLSSFVTAVILLFHIGGLSLQ